MLIMHAAKSFSFLDGRSSTATIAVIVVPTGENPTVQHSVMSSATAAIINATLENVFKKPFSSIVDNKSVVLFIR